MQEKTAKKTLLKNILLLSLVIIGVACITMFVIINYIWKNKPPTPASSAEVSSTFSITSSVPVSSIASSKPVSSVAESIVEDAKYPTDKLFKTKTRNSYEDGQMVLRVPRLDLITPILNGTQPETLDRGVGLYDYAQLPGKLNVNTSMTAHRNIEFEFINTITTSDMIYIEYEGIEYTYKYEDTTIVKNDDWSIIRCRDYAIVTLVSCHPINSSQQRMAVVGRLISQKPIEKAVSSTVSSEIAPAT